VHVGEEAKDDRDGAEDGGDRVQDEAVSGPLEDRVGQVAQLAVDAQERRDVELVAELGARAL